MMFLAAAMPAIAGAQDAAGGPLLGERTARNGLFVELGGNAIIYSLNYERFVTDNAAIRAGFGWIGVTASATDGYSTDTASASFTMIPLTASYLGLRSGNHALELGGGAVIVTVSGSVSNDASGAEAFGSASGVVGTGIVGWRYAPLNGGFNFRVAYTPVIGSEGLYNWFGVAAGAVF